MSWTSAAMPTGVPSPAGMIRVAVVDDDVISRRGLASLLDSRAQIEVVAELSHDQALAWAGWRGVHVAVVDAADERRADDNFPGVAVVERIRRYRSPNQARVVVVTGHALNDAVRRRMREAGADFLYDRGEITDAEALCAAVLRPEPEGHVLLPLDGELLLSLGVGESSRVNAAVAFAVEHDLRRALGSRPRPRSRSWTHLRRDFNERARLLPVTVDGRPPDRAQGLPSLSQIARFLAWATQVNDRPAGSDQTVADPASVAARARAAWSGSRPRSGSTSSVPAPAAGA